MKTLYVGSDVHIALGPVTNFATDEPVIDGEATFSLTNLAGNEVETGSLSHTEGGVYVAIMPGDNLLPNTSYVLTIELASGGNTLTKMIPCFAVYDSASVVACADC